LLVQASVEPAETRTPLLGLLACGGLWNPVGLCQKSLPFWQSLTSGTQKDCSSELLPKRLAASRDAKNGTRWPYPPV